jgi:hypothetical protein
MAMRDDEDDNDIERRWIISVSMVVSSFRHGYGCQSVSLSDSQVENVPTTSRGIKSMLPEFRFPKYFEMA